ncbi:MAG: hypothetical protein ACLFV2_00095 [Desulfurivibrionaceae bacterium]
MINGKKYNNKTWPIEELFQKLREEADDWPVECFTLTDSADHWRGVFFVDQNLEKSKKKKLASAMCLFSFPDESQIGPEPREKRSSAVSAEERTLLFSFHQSPSSED